MAQMKEHFKVPEKIQLSDKAIANLSDAQFKTLVIKKLTELVEFGHKLDEKMKAMLRETTENVQGTNSDGKETDSNQRCGPRSKKETSNQKRMKKQEFGKMRRGLETSRVTLNVPTSESQGCQRRRERARYWKSISKNNERKLP